MDFMEGTKVDHLNHPWQSGPLSAILSRFESLKSDTIGPLSGGAHTSIVFGEDGGRRFQMVQDMEAWFSQRLFDTSTSVCSGRFEPVLCHLDLICRNILWHDELPPCVLD